MGILLNLHVYTPLRRQRLLESHSHAEANDRGERAMCDGGGDQDQDADERVGIRAVLAAGDEDVWQVDDGQ